MRMNAYLLQTRPQFLLLSLVLAFLGTSMAWYYGSLHLGYALLACIGLLLTHISVNVFNDYFDYKSGIDLEVVRTPFSGGSGILPANLLKPMQAFWFALATFLAAIPIGGYLMMVSGWLLLPLLIVGASCILLYTPILTKLVWPEWSAGVGLGALPVLGFYFIQTGEYTLPAIAASVPSAILVHNLLFLNEFPDVEADRKGGRKTLPIIIGKTRASILYSVLTLAIYLWIISSVVTGLMPAASMIALLTLPLAVKAIQYALRYQDAAKLALAMRNNVLIVLLIQFLLGSGYVIGKIFQI